MVIGQLIGMLIAGALTVSTPSAPTPSVGTSTTEGSSQQTVAAQTSPWELVVYDRFNSGGVPKHWSKYSGRYGSGAENCARRDHAFVKDGRLRMVLRYRSTGDCGPGWYSAGMKLSERFESVDQRISVRFRVKSVGGIRGHRIIPMRWPSSGDGDTGGEEDFCEESRLVGCTTFLHNSDGQLYHRYSVDLTEWHTMMFARRNFTVRAFIDGTRRWVYHGTRSTLPATLKRAVLQQECQSGGCPSGTSGREVILIDWIKVWNPAT
jgi:hypothetical protein